MTDRLAAILGRFAPEHRPVAEPEPRGNAGGLSGARIWRYESSRGAMALRAWPVGRSREEVEAIHGRVRRLRPLPFIPVPVAARDGRTAIEAEGRVFEVAPWMPGEAEDRSPPPVARVRSAFAALAEVHRALGPGEVGGFSPSLAARAREIAALPGHLAGWSSAIASAPEDGTKALARRWVEIARRAGPALGPEIREAASRPVAIQAVIRDARPEHVLFLGDRVTGLVDFGAMGPDPVSADLARLMSEWLGDHASLRSEALAAYGAIRPLSPVEAGLIGAFERSAALLGGARWVRWHFAERVAFEDRSAPMRGLARAVERAEGLG